MELQKLEIPTHNAEGIESKTHEGLLLAGDASPRVITREPTVKLSVSLLGITFAILAALSSSVMAVFVKLAQSVPVFELVFYRSVAVMVFLGPYIIYFSVPLFAYPRRQMLYVGARAGLAAFGVFLKVYGLKNLPLADATIINFTIPVFTAILGYFILKESLHPLDVLAGLLSLGGVILIARPTFIFGTTSGQDFRKIWLPVLACLVGAFTTALSVIAIRKVGKIDVAVIIFYLTLAMFVTSLPASLIDGEINLPQCETYENWYIFLVAVFAMLLQIFLNKALALETALICTIAKKSDIVFAFILQVTVFSAYPSPYSIGGAILIILCNVIIFVRKYIAAKREVRKLITDHETE